MMKRGRRRLFRDYTPRYSGTHPTSVTIDSESFDIDSWRDILLKTCQLVLDRNPSDFPKVLLLKGSSRPWFSRDPDDLRDPIKVEGTDIFAETNHNANQLVLHSLHVLKLFGLEPKIDIGSEK
jgi:hypothetical protein